MAGITGLGSGLDINSLVQMSVNAEVGAKSASLSRQTSTAEAKLSALGKLQSAVSTFQTSLQDLNKLSLYTNRKATTSDNNILGVSADKNALAGKYSVEVNQLAASSKVATGAVNTDFTASAAGTLTVALGGADDEAVSVNIAEGATLTEIRDALNEQLKDKGISANIVNNPTSGTSQLVLTSSETGTGKDIHVTGSEGFSVFDVNGSVKAEGGAGYLQQAQNAVFKIDGIELQSESNTIKNAIPDVELTLKKVTEDDKPMTVTVGEDTAGVKEQLKKFVSAYNDLMSTTKDLTRVTSVGENDAPVTGGLVGDSTVRNLVNGVRAEMGRSIGGGSDEFRMLSDLGITMDKDGKLQIDDKKLDAALETGIDKVGAFMTGDNGLITRLENRVDPYAGKSGIIGLRQDSLNAQRADIKKQEERLALRAEQVEARLFKQFNTMDALVGQLSQTSSSIMASLASLPGFSSGN